MHRCNAILSITQGKKGEKKVESQYDADLQDIKIDPELVIMNLEASSDQEALEILARRLFEKGYVKESYVQAVKNREKTFPTGLEMNDTGIALPHTDSIHVNQQAIAIGVLKRPVAFVEMGTESDPVNVELMFMLAVKKADSQVNFLGRLLDAFQKAGRLKDIKNAATPEEITMLFKQTLK